MRGYLQHLVANGAGLERTVHPLIGGMFQGAAWEEMIEASTPTEQSSVTESPSRLTKTIVPPGPQAAVPGSALVQEQSQIGLTKAVSKGIVPTVPQKEDELEAPTVRDKQLHKYRREEVRRSRLEKPVSVVQEQTGGDVTNSSTLPKAAPLVLRPLLVTEMPKRVTTEEELRNRQSAENVRATSTYPETHHHTLRRTFRQDETKPTEDIQIHIGRIEVVAVPQAPVSNPPKTVRKSPSLEEYLKRSSGRGS